MTNGNLKRILILLIKILYFCFFVCNVFNFSFFDTWRPSFNVFFVLRIARQLIFSIDSTTSSLGKIEPFEWGLIEASELRNPPGNARNLTFVSNSSDFVLFVDGERPLRNAAECQDSSTCSTNCPVSERDALISRHRRALLCLKGTSATRTLQFTCSVPCPAWRTASPRIVWLRNGTVVYFETLFPEIS